MIGNSKDAPANAETAGKPAAAAKKSKGGRAKKPKKAGVDEQELAPDSLMMVSGEEGQKSPEESGTAAVETPEPAKKPEPPSARTTVPSPPGRPLISALPDWRIFAAAALTLVLLGLAALALFGYLPLPAIGFSAGTFSPVVPVTTTPNGAGTSASVTPAVTSTAETVSLVPGPTKLPPENFLVYFQAERDPRNHLVTVQYMGGKGQYAVQEVFVRLTRSDGQVMTGTFRPIQIGSGVELQGTEKTDRLEVIVRYSTGDEYPYIDKLFEYKIRN
jgi:hypothetical protein